MTSRKSTYKHVLVHGSVSSKMM